MNAHQRRVHRREAERAFQRFRLAGIPVEQARHWAEARASRLAEDYDPERPLSILWSIHLALVATAGGAVVVAAGFGIWLALFASAAN